MTRTQTIIEHVGLGVPFANWQLIEFGNTVHSFSDKGANIPGKAVYSPRVVRRAFRMVHDFFVETVG